MPIYQLPNGKIVRISLEDLLNMTDEDEQSLIADNRGDYPTSTLYGSAITGPQKKSKKDFYDKDGLDFEQDNEEFFDEDIDINNLPDEDTLV